MTATAAVADPRFAVVLIVRDGERFIAEAIESVRRQSVQAWELVVVDDGSRDRTVAIVDELVSVDSRIRRVAHPGGGNRGMSASRNLGVAATRAPLVTFLDHDDHLEARKLEVLGRSIDAAPTAVAVVAPNLRWRSWAPGGVDSVQDLGAPPGLLDPPGTLPLFVARSERTPLGSIFRRSAFDAVGGCETAFRAMYEDQALLAKVMLRFPVVVATEVLHRYRLHERSCVAEAHRRGVATAARRRYFRWLAGEVARSPLAQDAALGAAIAAARPSALSAVAERLRRCAITLGEALRRPHRPR
jgi:glycosyltransferase involved in cell wall biosynthesis